MKICGCGCRKPYEQAVRDVMRTMLLNRDQAEAIVTMVEVDDPDETEHG